MSDRNRQLLLLVVLIVAFVGLIGRQFIPAFGGTSGSAPRRAQALGPDGTAGGPVEIAELRLDALEHKPATYQPGRDPFHFGPIPQKPPPRRPKPGPNAKRRAAEAQRQQQRPASPPPPPPPPKPPAIEFVFLGSFGVSGREIAVFSDGKEILNAFAGDVLRQEFVVRTIGYESADIGFVNFPDAPAERLAVGG